MKATVRKRAMMGIKTFPQLLPHKTEKTRKKKAQARQRRPRRYRPGTRALCEIRNHQKSTELLIPKMLFYESHKKSFREN